MLTLICENLYKTRNTTARPIAKFMLYIAAKNIKTIRIKFPKKESNKLTKRLGTANITTHSAINNVINPTTKLRFLRDKILSSETAIYIMIKKKIERKLLKMKSLYSIIVE